MKKKGALYREGLKAIAEKYNVSLKRALEIALKDIENVGGKEHIKPTLKAYRNIKKRGEDS